jgi:hypothetical protein
MSGPSLTTYDARALFAAAQADGPGADERDAMFARLALATGIAVGAAAAANAGAASAAAAANVIAAGAAPVAAAASAGAGTFGMKLLALGALLGAASTALGVLIAVAVVTPDGARAAADGAKPSGASTGSLAVGAIPTTPAPARVITSGVRLAPPSVRSRAEAREAGSAQRAEDASAAPSPSAGSREGSGALSEARASARVEHAPSDLDEEARLVTAARSALLAGDPARALALVRATRRLTTRALEPEELGLEARALHALGRTDEAAATELLLRQRHPDHALAR